MKKPKKVKTKELKGKSFKRISKGAAERAARRYLQRKNGSIELVYLKDDKK